MPDTGLISAEHSPHTSRVVALCRPHSPTTASHGSLAPHREYGEVARYRKWRDGSESVYCAKADGSLTGGAAVVRAHWRVPVWVLVAHLPFGRRYRDRTHPARRERRC